MDKKVLLIADDESMNRKIIRKFLQEEYEILEAADGKEALETLESKKIDALLLDIIMPEHDGLEILEYMKKDPKFEHIGVLVATSTKERTERTALSLGADDIVSKPYDPVVIKKRMANILAVKEVQVQKNSLQTQDIDAFLESEKDKLSLQISSVVRKIVKATQIINANKSNLKLVGEVSSEIEEEAKQVLDLLKSEE